MQPATRSAITLFATIYLLALLAGSPSAIAPLKIFLQNLPTMSVSVATIRHTGRAEETRPRFSRNNNIQECTMQIQPYLNFNGNCKEAFEFYARVLKGKIDAMLTHAEAPPEAQAGPEWRDKILHAHLSVGDAVLMASDVPADRYQPPRSFSVSLQINDIAEAERVFKELSEGSTKIMMPIQSTFWAARFAMFFDRYGIPWMINCNPPAA